MRDVEISVVAPVFHEETTIPVFVARVRAALERVTTSFEIIFGLDPSSDATEAVARRLAAEDPRIRLIIMSRRFGQPAATMAAIEACSGKACIVLDADLQDPPEIIPALVEKWREGHQVVFAQRRTRHGERRIKRMVAHVGYWLVNRLSDVPIPRDTGDCRLIDRTVIDVLRQLPEQHGFLRGLVAFAGYKQTMVPYDRDPRSSGTSKYSPSFGSVRIGMNGIIAFSSKPLMLVFVAGCGLARFAVVVALWHLLEKFYLAPEITPGLTTTVVLVSFFSGLQLIGLGIIAAYVGRIYDEVRRRPRYLVADRVNFDDDSVAGDRPTGR